MILFLPYLSNYVSMCAVGGFYFSTFCLEFLVGSIALSCLAHIILLCLVYILCGMMGAPRVSFFVRVFFCVSPYFLDYSFYFSCGRIYLSFLPLLFTLTVLFSDWYLFPFPFFLLGAVLMNLESLKVSYLRFSANVVTDTIFYCSGDMEFHLPEVSRTSYFLSDVLISF